MGKKCGRCSTRYCGPACQKKHWEEGGHDQLCKKIKKAGGAEQYNANKKHAEAVAVAVEKCADDTKGQTCFICTQALHWKTKEGLVRGCSCRGTAGFAHVSCLAEQAKILIAEAVENNLGNKVGNERFQRWSTCSLCEQSYHGVVKCALGWACWKTYVGLPETARLRVASMTELGNGLFEAGRYEEALSVREADLSLVRRLGLPEQHLLIAQGNLAITYRRLGRAEQAFRMRRDVYFGTLKKYGEEYGDTLLEANNYAADLLDLQCFKEARKLLRKTIPVARRVLGENHDTPLRLRWTYAKSLYEDAGATLADIREAVRMLDDIARTARRVFGGSHPVTAGIELTLRKARAALHAREMPP